jgi:hypothetical protein
MEKRGIATFYKTQNKTILKKIVLIGIVIKNHIRLQQDFFDLILPQS